MNRHKPMREEAVGPIGAPVEILPEDLIFGGSDSFDRGVRLDCDLVQSALDFGERLSKPTFTLVAPFVTAVTEGVFRLPTEVGRVAMAALKRKADGQAVGDGVVSKGRPGTVAVVLAAVALAAAATVYSQARYDRLLKDYNRLSATLDVATPLSLEQEREIVRKIVADRLVGNVGLDTRMKVADAIVETSREEKLPLAVVLGLIDVESHWKVDAVSNRRAYGLTQTLLKYAIPYMKSLGVAPTVESLKDPVINVKVGIKMLGHEHEHYVRVGKADPENYLMALHAYFWGATNTNKLFGRSDKCVDVPNMSYPLRVLDRSRSYRDLFKS